MTTLPDKWLSPKTITSLGLGTIIALFLVYELVQMLPAVISKIDAVEAKLDTYSAVDSAAHGATIDAMEASTKLLRGICINTAEGRADLLSNCNP